jgi:transcriptional regulator with XRE-family HTH domain
MGYVVMDKERVKELREERGMTRRDLAGMAGISVSTAKRVERQVPVTFRTGRAVAGALGVEPSPSLGRVVESRPGPGLSSAEPGPQLWEDARMHEDLEAWVALLVAMLSAEEYERFGPAVQELGLAVAEFRQAQREAQGAREGYERTLEGLDRAEERVYNAIRLWEDAE